MFTDKKNIIFTKRLIDREFHANEFEIVII